MSGTNPNPNPPAGDDPNAGGAGDPQDKSTVTREAHDRLLSEKKKEQEKRKQAEDELARLKQEKADREKAELESKGQYKELLEAREKELEAERLKNKQFMDELHTGRKKRAILSHISGKVADKATELLPLSMVELDANGHPTEASAKAAAQFFEKDYSFAILRDGNGNGGLPNNAPKGGNKKLTKAEWEALPAAEMKKRAGEVDWDAK